MKPFITFIFLFCFDFGLAQPTSFQLSETLVIGEDQSEEEAYIFGQPDKVQVDLDGNIYVSDRSDHTIRIFDSEGTYQHSIGGRGRGPGEFLELTDFRLQTDGNLVALDRMQSRVTIFDLRGNVIHEHLLPGYIEGSANYVFQAASDDQYLLGYINLMQQQPNGHFLHLFDSDFENKISEHYDLFDTYFDGSNPLEERLSKSYSKKATLFHGQQIAIVPNIYTGTVHTLNIEDLTMSMMGKPVDDVYKELDWNQSESIRENNPVGLMNMSGPGGQFIFRVRIANLGLTGNQHFLLQFYGDIEGRNIIPQINIYTPDGSLLISQNISDELNALISGENAYSFRPAYLDNENKLYVIDTQYRSLYPTIRVFETNLDEFLDE